MEYLPEKKRTQKTQIIKKEEKIRQFRQELVDNNVVLAIVKCKLYSLFISFGLKDNRSKLTEFIFSY